MSTSCFSHKSGDDANGLTSLFFNEDVWTENYVEGAARMIWPIISVRIMVFLTWFGLELEPIGPLLFEANACGRHGKKSRMLDYSLHSS